MAIRKGKAYTVSFAAIDSTARPTRKTGISFATGDSKVSKDGGSFANTTNTPTELGSTGRYKLDLTATEMAADFIHILVEKSGIDPVDFQLGTAGYESGTVLTDGSNTSTTFKTDRTSSTNDDAKDALVVFTSGTLAGQVKKASAYNGSTKFLTVATAFTGTPSNGDRFILVNV